VSVQANEEAVCPPYRATLAHALTNKKRAKTRTCSPHWLPLNGQAVYACDGDVRPTLGIGLGWWCGNTIEAKPENRGSWNYVKGIPAPPIFLA
jgi:hypothetical protein